MSAIVVIGSQWGDEGKGKLIDAFAAKADVVVRFQGGANAGHTLIVNGRKTVLHLIPSGILHPHIQCLIASGVTVDPFEIVSEIAEVQRANALVSDEQLLIADGALLVLPFHRQLDRAREAQQGGEKIGTTGRGIGPSYEDRASRRALLFRDLFSDKLHDKLRLAAEEKNFLLEKMYNEKPVDVDALYEQLKVVANTLAPYRCPHPSRKIERWTIEGKKVLFEGAQGVLLDNMHGTYPFVTSSNTSSAAACVSSGLSPKKVNRVIGITKAYCTRVGAGPFPTELFDAVGSQLQEKGHEFGATTGRKRRCGWLDLVALRYAIRVSGIDSIVLTKLDVLSHFTHLKICTAYKFNHEIQHDFCLASNDLDQVEPQYEELKGWNCDISQVRAFDELPAEAKAYIAFIEQKIGVPATVISVGADREQTIYREDIFGETALSQSARSPEIALN